MNDLSIFNLNKNPLVTVRAGVFQLKRQIPFIPMFRAGDHQQEIDRSPHFKGFPLADGNDVKVVTKRPSPAGVGFD